MLKTLSIFIFLAVVSAEDILQDEDLKFNVVTSTSIEMPPTIQVRFSSGEQDDLILKHYRINEYAEAGCNYLGHLQNDPSSSVAVTGCLNSPEDKLEITMVSDNYLKTVSVDFQGNTQKIKNPYEEEGIHTTLRNEEEWYQSDDELINDNLEKQAQDAKTSSIPSKLRATIRFGYEDSMKEWLGSQSFDSWIQAPLTHAQAIYKHKSLGTEIEFEVVGKAIYQTGARWTPIGEDFKKAIVATQAAMLNEPAVVYSWWCSADRWGGALGAMGALCQDYNVNLNMRTEGALKNGMILAHELGHNFGMMHDFDDSLGGKGNPCNGDGLMSYGSFDQPLRWSSCSRASFEHHYFGLDWGCNCLLDISEDSNGKNNCEANDHPGLENKGKDCWVQCLGQQGPCPQFCGTGMCCRYGYEDTSGGCDGSIGLMGMGHICWADPNYKEEDTDPCPESHPYAYYDGQYCCASDYEKIYEPQGTKCDGSKIQLDSLCCGSEYIACPNGLCSNAADKGNGDEIDLCGHSCQSVISMSAPCTTTWEMGCGAIDPPEGFTSQSTLYDLCPNECPGPNDPGNSGPGQNEPACEDKLPTKRCEKRKELGKCSKKGIQKKCQKTCGLCA